MYKCPKCGMNSETMGECPSCKVQMVEEQANSQSEQAQPSAEGEAGPATDNPSQE